MAEDGGLPGPVLVVGAGLLGTSIGLALTARGVEVWLSDLNPEHVRTASGLGAGTPLRDGASPSLVVVAVPPDAVGARVHEALEAHPGAVVTDVGSVKSEPLEHLRRHLPDDADSGSLARYVGSHPMAGSERSGPLAASAALFDGRPWAVTPHERAAEPSVQAVLGLVALCGASPVVLSPAEHDQAVARISHLPHLMAVLVAGRLAGASAEHLALSGQGVRDVTRIAAGDPRLWEQIIGANAPAVLTLLEEVQDRLATLHAAVSGSDRAALGTLLAEGVAGTRAIPGKHGGPVRPTGSVYVAVPDHPGELARLFADAGEARVNVEDIHIDHDPGRPVGQVELVVDVELADQLCEALVGRGWTAYR
ncbi:prephenate dehydrogenase [Nocardioides donggukensis]|uniref:Prephenate dehydrogenase n=1 Tax=Nocardioides donggukensis TaxID=2774019 RepID=A0A927K5C3_9ACTN|nr:prephenate dehydrogenase [Nocardioides donggukensis]MBD8869288.1 prephenate dehydrogenase [Nocardioides donggukensis]